MVFFGAVSGGYAHALEWSLVLLAGVTTAVAVLGTLLHRHRLTTQEPEGELTTVAG
jgi:hypothetical protein